MICADVNAHDTTWDQTVNINARGEYPVNAAMDFDSIFLNDPEQVTRQDQATCDFSSPDVTIVHAAFRHRYDLEQLDTLSSDYRPILITIHHATELKGIDGSLWIGRWGIWPPIQQQLMNNRREIVSQTMNP